MANDTKMIHNVLTGEVKIVELSNEEQAQRDAEFAEAQAIKIAKQAEAEAKAQAKAQLLAQLGITEEQAKLLLS